MITGELDAARTSELRRSVLRPAWAPGTPMPGDEDPGAVHIGASDEDGQVVGACLLIAQRCPHRPDEDGAWQLRGMATDPDHRGRGVGGTVLTAALDSVRRRGARLVWCRARITAAAFYATHGFVVDGPDYLEPVTGLLHRDMSCGLTDRPDVNL